MVTPVGAMRNIGEIIRLKSHIRDPSLVDQAVSKGYESLLEAELHYTEGPLFYHLILP